jgi:outer membrane protein TolC
MRDVGLWFFLYGSLLARPAAMAAAPAQTETLERVASPAVATIVRLPPVQSRDTAMPRAGAIRGPQPANGAPCQHWGNAEQRAQSVAQEGALRDVLDGRVAVYEPTQPAPVEIMPIDLVTSWRLAWRQNPTIELARQVVQENLAYLLQSRTMALPSLNAGAMYHLHNGNLQRSTGQILNVPDEQSLYAGGGSRTVAAETVGIPAVQFYAPVANAWFNPLAARQDVAASEFSARATSNSILLVVTTHYMELLGAESRFDALRQSELEMAAVLRPTLAFAEAGQGLESDANRARSDALLLRSRVQAAEGDIAEASARLAELLQLNPSTGLRTPGGQLAIVVLIDPGEKLERLIETALQFRPEMGARNSEIAAAEVRFRQEQLRPLLPTVAVGFSGGTFGGGSDLVVPTFGRFAGRSDFDAVAYWTLQNLGFGNAALRGRTRSVMNESLSRRALMANQIRDEVASAFADAAARLGAVYVSQRRLATAEQGFKNELLRARNKQGLPIEALNMVHLLTDARQELVRAVVEYNEAEFRLFVALGQPPHSAIPVRPRQAVPGTGKPCLRPNTSPPQASTDELSRSVARRGPNAGPVVSD